MTSPLPTDAAADAPSQAAASSASRSIQRPLFLAAATFILVTGGLVGWALHYLRVQAISSGERLNESFAQVIEEQTSRTLQTVDQRLQLAAVGLAQIEQAGGLNEQTARTLLREQIAALPFVRAMWVMDAQGHIIYDTDTGNIGINLADRAYFQIYLREPFTTFHVGSPVRSRTTNAWLVSATRPLPRRDGAFAGIIVAALDPLYLDKLWRGVDLGADGSIGLFQRDGVLVMRSPMEDAMVGKAYRDLAIFSEPHASRTDGHFRNASVVDGKVRIFAYRSLSAWPQFTVTVGQSYDVVLAPWRRWAGVALAIWTTGALAIVVLCAFLNRAWQQRLRGEDHLQHMAQRLALATEAAAIGVWDWDLRADRWVATATCFRMLGQAPRDDAFPSAFALKAVLPDDQAMVAAQVQAALDSSDSPYQFEARMRHVDGSYRWVRVVGRVLARDAQGAAIRMLGVSIDVTAARQTQSALQHAKEYAENLIANANAMVVGLDLAGRITLFNHAAEAVTGYRADEVLGRDAFEVLVPRARFPEIWAAFSSVPTGALKKTAENPIITRSGEERLISWQNSEIVEDGRVLGVLSFGIDLTERKRAEEVLEKVDAELRVVNRTLTVMIECNQALVRATAESGLLDEMCRIFVGRGGYALAWVGFARQGGARTVHVAARRGESAYLETLDLSWGDSSFGQGPAARAIRSGQAVVIRDTAAPDDGYQDLRADMRRFGLRSSLVLPLGQASPAFGVLCIYSADPDGFNDEEVRLLVDLANHLAYGIQSLRTETRRREAVRAQVESEKRYRMLVDLSPYAIGVLQDERLVIANPATIHLFGATSAEQLMGRAVSDMVHPDDLATTRERLLGMLRGDTGLYPAEVRYLRFDGTVIDVEVSATPFTYQDRPAAQIIALDITQRKLAEAALRDSRQLLQSLSRRVLEAQETERRRVAHELHDELGQSLTAIKINLQARERFKEQSQDELNAENMRMVEDALQQVRRLALALRPSMLDDLGLVPALRWMAEQSASRSDIAVRFEPRLPPVRLAPEIETACFRIAQEALTNIARYARAQVVEITLAHDGDTLVLCVQDDGCGFDVAAMRARAMAGGSIGVLGMQERAALIGGQLDIDSSPGRGSTVRLRCPWRLRT